MKKLWAGLAVGAIAGGIFMARKSVTARGAAAAADDERISTIEQDVQAMRRHVSAMEALNGRVVAKALAGESSKRGTGDRVAEEAQPTARPATREEMIASFKTYFDQLDALRGAGTDAELTERFNAELSTDDWKDGAPGSPSAKAVACGNGYCRVSLTFKDAAGAEEARMRLMLSLGKLASNGSVFFDPDALRVEGYFATGDKTWPPFPGTGS